ncbi:hypothetical protein B2G71_04860 [Novosphingobium sp. PC22D]|nr:hypothetical protein B2G71_04860 [Novosphingobium sp. PC22D]
MARPASREARAATFFTGGAAVLAGSVLADSATEHYRGSFRNPAMVLPLLSASASLIINGGGGSFSRKTADVVHVAAGAVGLGGLGFHAWNVGRQTGGYRLGNLLYKAPLGAPGALVLTGLLGAIAGALRESRAGAVVPRLVTGRAAGAVVAFGLAGTVAEAGLLHFRGAFHNPAMWLPVSIPPLTALSLARDVARAIPSPATPYLLAMTATLGLAGAAFHAWGVSRNMGGWRNWRQNLLAGPPIPAPPSFTGLAIAGFGALLLLKGRTHG